MVCLDRVDPTLSMCSGDDGDFSIAAKKLLRYFWGTKWKMSWLQPLQRIKWTAVQKTNKQKNRLKQYLHGLRKALLITTSIEIHPLKMSPDMSTLRSGKAEKKTYFPLAFPAKHGNCFILHSCDASANHDLLILLSSITKHCSRCKPQIYSAGISLHMDTKGLQKSFPHQAFMNPALKRICFDQGHLHKYCMTSITFQNLTASFHWVAL